MKKERGRERERGEGKKDEKKGEKWKGEEDMEYLKPTWMFFAVQASPLDKN